MNRKFLQLWVDDERKEPPGWDRAFSFHEAIFKLEILEYNELSLDHDLASFYGNREMTGYDIINWLAERKQRGLYVPNIIHVHSANPVGHQNILNVINKFWDDK